MALQETLCGLGDSGFWYLVRPAKRSFHKIMTSDSSFYSTMWMSHYSINAEPLMESQPKDMRIEFCRKMRPLLWQQQQQQENPKENFFLMSRQSQALPNQTSNSSNSFKDKNPLPAGQAVIQWMCNEVQIFTAWMRSSCYHRHLHLDTKYPYLWMWSKE